MQKPKIKVGATEHELPHHQGYSLDTIINEDKKTTIDGHLLIDYTYSKYGGVLKYDVLSKEDFETVKTMLIDARETNTHVYFTYEKLPAYSAYKKVQMTIDSADFRIGSGTSGYYYRVNISFIDVDPR